MRLHPALLAFVLGPASIIAVACGTSVDTTPKSSGAAGGGMATTSAVTTGDTAASVSSVTVGTGGMFVDAGPDVGVPSDMYPAPHMQAPKVVTLGGPILDAPKIYPVYFSNDDPTIDMEFTDFVSKLGATNYWKAVVSEYGVGPAVGEPPIQLVETSTGVISDAQIAAWLAMKLNSNDPLFPVADHNTLFALYYPKGTSITLESQGQTSQSCKEFGGYHSSTTLDANHGSMNVAYAVIPRCNNFDGFNGLDATTAAASHEFVEATTDPYPNVDPAYAQCDNNDLYWLFALGGGEAGDLCAQNPGAFTQFAELPYVVQRTWSNLSAFQSHDPCVPELPGEVYFNSAPNFKDTLTLGAGGQTLKLKGIKIEENQSAVLEVDLFSDGPTGGPWNVTAQDANQFMGGQPLLDFSFDQSSGQNGQKLHLTINVLTASADKAEIFYLFSQLDNQTNMWVGIVGN